MGRRAIFFDPILIHKSPMSQSHNDSPSAETHVLQCMEIWSGNKLIESTASSTGLDLWIYSQPYLGQSRGGDVHYLSLCVGGIVTRIVLADVSGHGNKVADTAATLRKLLRKYMNTKKQERLVGELNREFSELEQSGRFATAIVATYLSHKNQLLLTNAGHPRPLLFRQSVGHWQFLDHEVTENERPDNLPLGFDGRTQYQHFRLPIRSGDLLLLYTDALTEARNSADKYLGEQGLLLLVQAIPLTVSFDQFGAELVKAVRSFSNGLTEDDETLIVIRFGEGRRSPGILEKLRGYAAVLRLIDP